MPETTIAGRQIRDGAITNAKVAAGAAIDSSKLADGANFIKKDGTVAMTGDLNLGNQKVVSLGTPTASGDATNKSYVDGLISALPSAYKYRNVHAATTANINLSNPGTDTFDGHALTNGQRLWYGSKAPHRKTVSTILTAHLQRLQDQAIQTHGTS